MTHITKPIVSYLYYLRSIQFETYMDDCLLNHQDTLTLLYHRDSTPPTPTGMAKQPLEVGTQTIISPTVHRGSFPNQSRSLICTQGLVRVHTTPPLTGPSSTANTSPVACDPGPLDVSTRLLLRAISRGQMQLRPVQMFLTHTSETHQYPSSTPGRTGRLGAVVCRSKAIAHQQP